MKIDTPRKYVVDSLRYALSPRSIAVVGASRYNGKVGYAVIDGLNKWGYKGTIYPVNPRAETVHGLKAYKTIKDIPGEVDLVFVAVPAHLVKMVLEHAVAKKAKIAVIATSAFKEIGRGDLQDELTRYCRANRLPLIGPNLVGMGSPYLNFNCGFIPYLPVEGPVAMISQSGANLLAALGTSQTQHFGMSFFVGLGNKADVDFSEFIEYAGQDEHTRCISVYSEGIDCPEAYVKACNKVVPHKPVVAIKVGGSAIGEKAAFAHTASENAGTDDAFYDDLYNRVRRQRRDDHQRWGLRAAVLRPLRAGRHAHAGAQRDLPDARDANPRLHADVRLAPQPGRHRRDGPAQELQGGDHPGRSRPQRVLRLRLDLPHLHHRRRGGDGHLHRHLRQVPPPRKALRDGVPGWSGVP